MRFGLSYADAIALHRQRFGQDAVPHPLDLIATRRRFLQALVLIDSLGERVPDKELSTIVLDAFDGVESGWQILTLDGDVILNVVVHADAAFVYAPHTGYNRTLHSHECCKLDAHFLFGPGIEHDLALWVGSTTSESDDDTPAQWKIVQLPPKTGDPLPLQEYFPLNAARVPVKSDPTTARRSDDASELPVIPRQTRLQVTWAIPLPPCLEGITGLDEVSSRIHWSIETLYDFPPPDFTWRRPRITGRQYTIPLITPNGKGWDGVFVTLRQGSDEVHVVGFGDNTTVKADELVDYFRDQIRLRKTLRLLTT